MDRWRTAGRQGSRSGALAISCGLDFGHGHGAALVGIDLGEIRGHAGHARFRFGQRKLAIVIRAGRGEKFPEQQKLQSQLMVAYLALGRAVALRELLQDALAGNHWAQLEGRRAWALRS